MSAKKMTQEDWVVSRLKKNGRVSRNECLRQYITRLSAIILNLRGDGWGFEASFEETNTLFGDKDYVYTVTKQPEAKEAKA